MARRIKLKRLALLPALALAVSTAACGGGDDGAGTDPKDLKLGVQAGTTSLELAKEKGLSPLEFDDAGAQLAALTGGRVDVILQDLPVVTGVGGWGEKASFSDRFEVAEEIKTGAQYGFAVQKGNSALLAVINSELQKAIDDGTWSATYKNWMGLDAQDTPAPETEAGEPSGDVKLATPGKLKTCTSLPYPPFQDKKGDDIVGFDVDIIDLVAKKLGVEQEIVDISFDSIKSGAALNAKKCDVAAAGMTITPERKENLDFSNPYFDEVLAFVTEKGAGVKLDDLAG